MEILSNSVIKRLNIRLLCLDIRLVKMCGICTAEIYFGSMTGAYFGNNLTWMKCLLSKT